MSEEETEPEAHLTGGELKVVGQQFLDAVVELDMDGQLEPEHRFLLEKVATLLTEATWVAEPDFAATLTFLQYEYDSNAKEWSDKYNLLKSSTDQQMRDMARRESAIINQRNQLQTELLAMGRYIDMLHQQIKPNTAVGGPALSNWLGDGTGSRGTVSGTWQT